MHPEDQLVHSFIALGQAKPASRHTLELECRICLEAANPAEEGTLKPCQCAGSVAHVHFACLAQWIEKHHRVALSETEPVDYFPCEMCKFEISFETEKRIQCLTQQQCAANCRKNKVLLAILLAMFLGFSALLVFGVYEAAASGVVAMGGSSWFESLLVLSSLLVVLSIQLLSGYCLLAKFLVCRAARIVKIGADPKGRTRSQSTCTSEANLLTNDRRIRNTQFSQIGPVLEDLPE